MDPADPTRSSAPQGLAALCLTGGGIMGLYTAHVLDRLQAMRDLAVGTALGSGALAGAFDILAGTSAGSLIVAGLATGRRPGEIAELFERHGAAIFPPRPAWRKALRPFSALYRREPLARVLDDTLGAAREVRLGDLDTLVALPAYNESLGEPVVFTNLEARHRGVRLRDVVLASSAAPVFLPAYRIGADRYVDGGLFANAPDMAALWILRRAWPSVAVSQIDMVSVGTGASPAASPRPEGDPGNWGFASWMTRPTARLLKTTLRAQADSLTAQMTAAGLRSYSRIDTSLPEREGVPLELDNASAPAMALLAEGGRTALDNLDEPRRQVIRRIVARRRWDGAGSKA